MANTKIEQIDKGLGRYYKLNCIDYFDVDGNGKFVKFCEDNGLNDDDVKEELENEAEDCLVIDFEDINNFPFEKEIKSDNKSEVILKIIKKCYNDSDAYKEKKMYRIYQDEIEKSDFLIDEIKRNKLMEIYRNECPMIFGGGYDYDRDGVIMNILYIAQNMNDNRYLQLLCDCYNRDKVNYHIEMKNTQNVKKEKLKIYGLKVSEWTLINKNISRMQNWSKNQDEFIMVESAISLCQKRISPLMPIHSQIRILDSYESVCEYISASVDFVANLANENNTNCPFQYDFCFAFNEVIMDSIMVTPIHDNNNNNNDDEEDVDDDDVDDKKQDDSFFDCFMNIKQRLTSEKLVFVSEEETDNKHDDDGYGLKTSQEIKSCARFKKLYKEFKRKIISNHNDKEFKQYPSRFRFISILDGRLPKDDNINNISEKDELIFLEPTSDCYKFPAKEKQCDTVWYFESSKTEIIPCIGYNEQNGISYNKEKKLIKKKRKAMNIKEIENKEELQKQTINTDHTMKNAMLLFSFHVDCAEEIRCYMYLGGCMMRFLASDLKYYLPQFFEKSDDNIAYIKNSENGLDLLISNIEKRLIDLRFNAFYKKYKIDHVSIKQDIEKKIQHNDHL